MFPFKKYRRGQSSLELLGVMVFVMMAIIIGGPYVVRSINSHFKSIEEGAIDSERERITEGPTSVPLPTCDCVPEPLCGDGTTIDGMACSKQKRIYNKFSCTPAGCDATLMDRGVIPPLRCGDDLTNTCCGDPTYSLCANDPGAIGTCVYGQREKQKWCGSPIPVAKYDCSPDALCNYTCDTLDINATWCQPNATLREQGLPSPTYPVKYLDNSVGCLGTSYCEAVCAAGFTAGPGGCQFPSGIHCGCNNCPNGTDIIYAGWTDPADAFPYKFVVCKLLSTQLGLEYPFSGSTGSLPPQYPGAVICYATMYFCLNGASNYLVGQCPLYTDWGLPADQCWEIIN